jgi:hypothetical protein
LIVGVKRRISSGNGVTVETASIARARYALVWRPRFLAALSMTHCVQLSCRTAKVSRDTAYEHRKADGEFAKQWDEAQEHALDLLHARVWQRSLEGDIEPVFYMGVPVAYIRKFSDKLQIELLRAYMPERFKTTGTNVNIGTRGDVFVLTEEQRHELIRINREWLLDPTTLPAERRSATEQPQRLTNGEGSALPASGEARSVRPVARPGASARTPGRSQGTLWLRTIER